MTRLIWSLVAIALTLTVPTARAGLIRTFDLTYSGADLGNSATAIGTITLDLTLTNNPGFTSQDVNPFVTAFSITVLGATSGNGTFGFDAYNGGPLGGFDLDTGNKAFNFNLELIGQPTGIDPFGTPGGEGGDFDILANGTLAAAPTATDDFQITTNGGNGDSLDLISFRPAAAVPEPGGLTLIASGLAAVAGRAGWRWFRRTPPRRRDQSRNGVDQGVKP